MLVARVAAMATEEGEHDELVLAVHPADGRFLCCWAGIPLWHTLTRWDAELKAKHAEIAATPVAAPVFTQPVRLRQSRTRPPARPMQEFVTRGDQSGWRQTEPPAWHDHDAGRAVGDGGPGMGGCAAATRRRARCTPGSASVLIWT